MTSKKLLLAICLGCLVAISGSAVSAFPLSSDTVFPSLSNKIETSSTMNLNVASFSTDLGSRFISGSADSGVEIFNNVQISSYSDALPSTGSVSAFIKGMTMEGGYTTKPSLSTIAVAGKLDNLGGSINTYEPSSGLFQTMEFSDFTSMSGDIISFSKFMKYSSAFA